MKMARHSLVLLSIVFIHACSSQHAYDMIQHNQRIQCQKVPHSEYAECMERSRESYGEYTQKREEATEQYK